MDIGTIVTWIVAAWNFIQPLLGVGKEVLGAAKTAKELITDTTELLHNPDRSEEALERAKVVSELMRSYALFGFLEYLFRSTMALLLLLVLRQAAEMIRESRRAQGRGRSYDV